MAIIKINIPVPGDGDPYVSTSFPSEELESKTFQSGDLVTDWFNAVKHAIDSIVNKASTNPMTSFNDQAWANYPKSGPVHRGYLLFNGHRWEIIYQKPPANGGHLYAPIFVPSGTVYSLKDLMGYIATNES